MYHIAENIDGKNIDELGKGSSIIFNIFVRVQRVR